MEHIDFEYLCRVIGNLAGIPVRIYKDKELTFFYSVVDFPADPIEPYLDNVFAITEHIGYFTTPFFNYYGIVRSDRHTVVIGPSRRTPMSDHDLRELAFACNLDFSRVEAFSTAMRSLVQMPLGSIVQILCTMNYVLNGEKRSLEDVTIYDFEQIELETMIQNEQFDKRYEKQTEYEPRETHNTLALEQALMQMIEKGDVGALCEWLSRAPSVRGGVIANDALRQYKTPLSSPPRLPHERRSRAVWMPRMRFRFPTNISANANSCRVLSPLSICNIIWSLTIPVALSAYGLARTHQNFSCKSQTTYSTTFQGL